MATQQEDILLKVSLDQNQVKQELVNIKSNITDLKNTNKELAKEAKAALEAADPAKYAELTEKIVNNEAAVRNLSTQQRNLQKSLDTATLAAQAQSGSYEQLYRQWQLAEVQLKTLGGSLQMNEDGTIQLTEAYTTQSEVVRRAKEALIEFNQGILDGRLNVGNYDNSLQGLEQKLTDLQTMFKVLDTSTPEFEKTRDAIKETQAQIAVLSGKVEQFAEGSIGALEQHMAQLQEKLRGLDTNSAEFTQTREEISALRGDIDQLSGKVDEFGNKEPKNPTKKAMEDATDAANGLVGAFTLVTLVGGKNEKASQLQAKALKAMAIMQALVNVRKGISATIDTAALVKQKALVAVTYAQAVAQRVLNAVMSANPVAIIVLAIVALIGAFIALKDKVKIIGAAFEALGKVFSAIGDALAWLGEALGIWGESEEDRVKASMEANEKLLKQQESSYNRRIRLAQAEGKNTVDLEKEKLAAMNTTIADQIANLKKLEQINGELTDEQKDQLDELTEKYEDNATEILAIELEKAKKLKEISDQAAIDALNNQIKAQELQGKQSFDLQRQLVEEQRKQKLANEELTAEQIKNINDDANNQLQEIQNKQTQFYQKAATDRLKIENDLQKSRIALIKNTEEQAIAAEKQALKEKLEQIKGNGAMEQELRANLTKASEERQAEIRRQFEDDFLKRTIETAQKKIEIEMISVRAGTQQEHELKLQALAAQRALEIQSRKVSLDKQLEDGVISQDEYRQQVALIDAKYRALTEKENKEFNDRVKMAALQSAIDKARAELIIANTSQESIYEQSLHFQKSTFDQQMKVLQAEYDAAIANEELTNEQRLVLEADFQAKKKELEDAAALNRLQRVQQNADLEMQFVALAANFAAGVEKNQNDKKLADIQSEEDAQLESLQNQLDAGLISQQQFDDQKAAIEARAKDRSDAIKLDQARADKQNATFNAIIAGAAAVVKALPNIPLSILAGLTAAAQIALIQSQPLPAFADSGRVLSGRRIGNRDGVPIRRSNGDNLLATVKTGEVILNETHQALLGGPRTFAAIGVPGFAGGGATSFAPVAFSSAGSARLSKFEIQSVVQSVMQEFPDLVVDVKDVNREQSKKAKVADRANI